MGKDINKMEKHELREFLSEKEHEQWESWSKTIAKELEKLTELIANQETDNALHLIEDRLNRWQENWKPYKDLTEEIKDYDRIWADKIIDEVDKYKTKSIDKDYISKRLKELSIMLANYEDSLEITPEGEDKEEMNSLIEINRAKIDELNRLKKELLIKR